jgi:hypothetical protein
LYKDSVLTRWKNKEFNLKKICDQAAPATSEFTVIRYAGLPGEVVQYDFRCCGSDRSAEQEFVAGVFEQYELCVREFFPEERDVVSPLDHFVLEALKDEDFAEDGFHLCNNPIPPDNRANPCHGYAVYRERVICVSVECGNTGYGPTEQMVSCP